MNRRCSISAPSAAHACHRRCSDSSFMPPSTHRGILDKSRQRCGSCRSCGRRRWRPPGADRQEKRRPKGECEKREDDQKECGVCVHRQNHEKSPVAGGREEPFVENTNDCYSSLSRILRNSTRAPWPSKPM